MAKAFFFSGLVLLAFKDLQEYRRGETGAKTIDDVDDDGHHP